MTNRTERFQLSMIDDSVVAVVLNKAYSLPGAPMILAEAETKSQGIQDTTRSSIQISEKFEFFASHC